MEAGPRGGAGVLGLEPVALAWGTEVPGGEASAGPGAGAGARTLCFPPRSYFIVMVPLRKSRGGQFLTPLGSPEDMDLEEVRPGGRAGARASPGLRIPRL